MWNWKIKFETVSNGKNQAQFSSEPLLAMIGNSGVLSSTYSESMRCIHNNYNVAWNNKAYSLTNSQDLFCDNFY